MPAGSYTISLSLLDSTTHAVTIQITAGHGSAGLTTVAGAGTSTVLSGLLGGDIDLFVDNSNGDLTADKLARIQDAVSAVDAVIGQFGVTITEISDPTLADVTLNMNTTSAVGSYAEGVLGCTTDAGQITILGGRNFYAGSNATQIGSTQYDFETVVVHELGHALGLGHSTNSASVMFATLNAGTANRVLATADLKVPDSDSGGACGLHADVNPKNQEPISKNSTTDYTDYTDFASSLSVFSVSSVVKDFEENQATYVGRISNPSYSELTANFSDTAKVSASGVALAPRDSLLSSPEPINDPDADDFWSSLAADRLLANGL